MKAGRLGAPPGTGGVHPQQGWGEVARLALLRRFPQTPPPTCVRDTPSRLLHDQDWRLVSIVVPLPDHSQRPMAERDRVAAAPVHYGARRGWLGAQKRDR